MQTVITTAPLPKTHGAILKPSISHFDSLPDSAHIDDKAVAVLTGWHRNTVWRKAKARELLPPIKVGPKSTRWQVGAIREYLASLTAQQSAA